MAYAFALQGLVFALDIGSAAFAAKNGAASAGFELCTQGGSVAAAPRVPDRGPMGNVHCMFCVAGAVFLDSTPPPPPHYHEVLLAGAVTTLSAPHLVTLLINDSAWPRGPPALV